MLDKKKIVYMQDLLSVKHELTSAIGGEAMNVTQRTALDQINDVTYTYSLA